MAAFPASKGWISKGYDTKKTQSLAAMDGGFHYGQRMASERDCRNGIKYILHYWGGWPIIILTGNYPAFNSPKGVIMACGKTCKKSVGMSAKKAAPKKAAPKKAAVKVVAKKKPAKKGK